MSSQFVTSDDDDAVLDLQSAASVALFESTDLSTFRATLTQALEAAISSAQASSSSSLDHQKQDAGWNHYSQTSFEDVLYSGIPWTELRRQKLQASRNDNNNTPLAEVIALLLNPCIVPPALSSSLAVTFFRVLVEDTANKSVSENPLLLALQRLFQTRPCIAAQVRSSWIAYIQTNVHVDANTVDSYNVERAHRLVSICKHLATSDAVDGTILVKCLLTLLQNLDDVDVHLLQQQKTRWTNRHSNSKNGSSSCCPCKKQRNTKRKRGARALDLLDDDLMNDEDADGFIVSTVHVAGGASVEKVSRVVSRQYHNPCTECNVCRIRKSSQGITQLPIQLVLLRSRLYKKVLSISSTLCTRNTEKELRSSQRRLRPTNRNPLLSLIVHHACLHPDSASLRLCVLLLADSLSLRGYQDVIGFLWRLYEHKTPILGKVALRIYSEFLVECSHFDDANRFWEALQTLMHQAMRYCDTKLASEDELDTKSSTSVRLTLRCLSYILCHRRHTLVPFEADPRWKKLVSKLAMTFEDKEWWLTNDMGQDDRKETLATLQAVGILGFLVDGQGKEVPAEKCIWPFTDGIRSAHRRMGPDVGRDGLLSKPAPRPTKPSKPIVCRKSEIDDCPAGVPIMDYLNDDLLRTIFSFLGYKRLVKASGICKAWKALVESDSLWHQAYTARFATRQECESTDVRWKTMFVNKVLAEKALRFKRHSSGWKHRTCEHIGCLMVLRSPNQMATHYRSHKKRTAKQQKKKRPVAKRRRLMAKDSQIGVKS